MKTIDMKNINVVSPFFMACSHYIGGSRFPDGCDLGINLNDDRICCECKSYDGGDVICLKWDNGVTYMRYPFKSQFKDLSLGVS